MKKLFFIIILAAVSITVCEAQIVKSRTFKVNRKHEVWMDIYPLIGSHTAKGELGRTPDYKERGSEFGAGLSIRWTKNFNDYIAVDFINFGAAFEVGKYKLTYPDNFSPSDPSLQLYLMLGPHFKLPLPSGKHSLFLNWNGGVAMNIENCSRNNNPSIVFINEANFGINFHERLILGIGYRGVPGVKVESRYSDSSFVGKVSHNAFFLKFGFSF